MTLVSPQMSTRKSNITIKNDNDNDNVNENDDDSDKNQVWNLSLKFHVVGPASDQFFFSVKISCISRVKVYFQKFNYNLWRRFNTSLYSCRGKRFAMCLLVLHDLILHIGKLFISGTRKARNLWCFGPDYYFIVQKDLSSCPTDTEICKNNIKYQWGSRILCALVRILSTLWALREMTLYVKYKEVRTRNLLHYVNLWTQR